MHRAIRARVFLLPSQPVLMEPLFSVPAAAAEFQGCAVRRRTLRWPSLRSKRTKVVSCRSPCRRVALRSQCCVLYRYSHERVPTRLSLCKEIAKYVKSEALLSYFAAVLSRQLCGGPPASTRCIVIAPGEGQMR